MYGAVGVTEPRYFAMLGDLVTSTETADRVHQVMLSRGLPGALDWDLLFARFEVCEGALAQLSCFVDMKSTRLSCTWQGQSEP